MWELSHCLSVLLISPSLAGHWLYLGQSLFSSSACLITTVLTMPPRICFPQMMKGCWFWQASSCLLVPHQYFPASPFKPLPHLFYLMSQLKICPPILLQELYLLRYRIHFRAENSDDVSSTEFKHAKKITYQWVFFFVLQYKRYAFPFSLVILPLRSILCIKSQMFIWYILAVPKLERGQMLTPLGSPKMNFVSAVLCKIVPLLKRPGQAWRNGSGYKVSVTQVQGTKFGSPASTITQTQTKTKTKNGMGAHALAPGLKWRGNRSQGLTGQPA